MGFLMVPRSAAVPVFGAFRALIFLINIHTYNTTLGLQHPHIQRHIRTSRPPPWGLWEAPEVLVEASAEIGASDQHLGLTQMCRRNESSQWPIMLSNTFQTFPPSFMLLSLELTSLEFPSGLLMKTSLWNLFLQCLFDSGIRE